MRPVRTRIYPRRQPQDVPTLRKVPADSVPYGENISRNGRTVWAAYDGDTLVTVGATSEEVRIKYREARGFMKNLKKGT